MKLKQAICLALTASLLSLPLPVLAAEAQKDDGAAQTQEQAKQITASAEESAQKEAEEPAATDETTEADEADEDEDNDDEIDTEESNEEDSGAEEKDASASLEEAASEEADEAEPEEETQLATAAQTYSLKFDKKAYTPETLQVDGKDIAFRAYQNIVYVAHPVATASQEMSIYIPEAYFHDGTINGYTKKTAPIFLPNGVGGYMPGKIVEPTANDEHNGGANAALIALSKGYVVASPAVRGRTTVGDDGKTYVGKAPALLVDYKAAVRYLRFNKHRLPAGNTDKIISNGTSAGGALSALLGATGDSPDYAAELKAIGAADERDDIFASSVYCPITDLEHADMAYEWMFNGVNDAHQQAQMLPLPDDNAGNMLPLKSGSMPAALKAGGQVIPLGPGPVVAGETGDTTVSNRPDNAPQESTEAVRMTPKQIAASSLLKALYPVYLNSLKLTDDTGAPLTLSSDGKGSFAAYIKSLYAASAQSALDNGEDLSDLDWLTIFNKKVIAVDLSKYAAWATRLKATPAFDKFDLSSGENDEFGTTDNTPRHFTGFSMRRNEAEDAEQADAWEVHRLNPLYYIGKKGVKTAKYWRIRHGAKDRDTCIAVPAVLATKLKNNGATVDFKSPWGYGHAGDYDLDELFDWMDSLCKPAETKAPEQKPEDKQKPAKDVKTVTSDVREGTSTVDDTAR